MEEASSGKKEAAPSSCRFLQFPYPLILDILSRLPVKDLLHCRRVCKRFLCFISDPEFARLHLIRSPLSILLKIRTLYAPGRLLFAHIDAADGANLQVSKLNFTPKFNVPTCDVSDISSCNGLICLVGAKADDPYDPFYICNPVLGEFITIQQPYSRKDRRRGTFWGFGYSSMTNQYKVLQSYNDNVDKSVERPEINDSLDIAELVTADRRVEIYTVGTGTWRSIGNAPTGFVSLPFNAYLNGAVHWYNVDSRGGGEFINSFDFDGEQFGTVPPPDHFLELDKECAGDTIVGLGVLGGCLFIIHFADSMKFDIWVMKEYGVKESWTKQFVIENLSPKENSSEFYQPMVVLSNGEILMLLERKAIVCYNQETKQLRTKFRTRSVLNAIDAFAYTPCFVSLYNVAKGERISRMQSTRVYDKICKEEFQDCTGCGDRLVKFG